MIKGLVEASLAYSLRWDDTEEVVSCLGLQSKGYLEILGLILLEKEQQFSILCFFLIKGLSTK